MAVVTALRFDLNHGALCIDRESWHIWRRKTYFSDHLYLLVEEGMADEHGLELAYAGVGHPAFHLEVCERARPLIHDYVTKGGKPEAEKAAHLVMEAFSEAHRRRINDKLRFLYGFGGEELLAGQFTHHETTTPINQDLVKQRALAILKGTEAPGYAPLAPPIEACIVGIDRHHGFSAYVIKDADGVVSFQSCGFEAIGQGRVAAAEQFSKYLNRMFLDQRRKGLGRDEGWLVLLEATLEACDHFGQVGGGVRAVELNAEGAKRKDRVRLLSDHPAKLALEIVRAAKETLLPRRDAIDLITMLVDKEGDFPAVERELFSRASNVIKLEKVLRSYKVDTAPLPQGRGVLSWLELPISSSAREGGGK